MRIIVLVMLVISAHFSLTAFAPGPKAWTAWPFGLESKSWLGIIGGLPSQHGGLATTLLAAVAGLGLLAAAISLFWSGISAGWWPIIVIASASASAILFVLYFGVWAIIPILLDLGFIWGVFFQQRTVASLRGG